MPSDVRIEDSLESTAGGETCDWCSADEFPSLEYHCSHCDAGICAACAVLAGWPREASCPDCHPSAPPRQDGGG